MFADENFQEPEPVEESHCFYGIERPSFKERFWRRMGYHAHYPDVDQNPEAAKMPGWFRTDVWITMSFMDRIRLLLSGRQIVRLECRANVSVDTVISDSAVSILPPGAKP